MSFVPAGVKKGGVIDEAKQFGFSFKTEVGSVGTVVHTRTAV